MLKPNAEREGERAVFRAPGLLLESSAVGGAVMITQIISLTLLFLQGILHPYCQSCRTEQRLEQYSVL